MRIEKYNKKDINKVIELLGTSFEVYKDNRSLEKFAYKHHDNPFGESIAYVAIENDEFIGFRSFMQWKWQIKNTIINSYRAVDAITHPNHLRKGVFNELTKATLKDIADNRGLIFNTPNHKSLQGNLKLGWSKIGNISFQLYPLLFNFHKKKKITTHKNIENKYDLEELCNFHNSKMSMENQLFTPKSVEYLKWRFYNNPFINYFCISEPEFFLSCYKKEHNKFNELRVSELILKSKKSHSIVKEILMGLAKENSCRIITISNTKLFNFGLNLKIGPTLVGNNFTNTIEDNFIQDISNWNYQLGDLELF